MFSVDYNGPLWRGTRRWPPVHDSRAVEARLLVGSRQSAQCCSTLFICILCPAFCRICDVVYWELFAKAFAVRQYHHVHLFDPRLMVGYF